MAKKYIYSFSLVLVLCLLFYNEISLCMHYVGIPEIAATTFASLAVQ